MTTPAAEPPTIKPYGLHDAAEAVKATLITIDERKDAVARGTAIANLWGIPDIDEYIVTLWPGQVIYTVALMSNGKSFVARMHAKHVLNGLMAADDERVVVWVTVEEPIEKVTAHWLGAMSGVSSTNITSGRISDVEMYTLRASIAEVTTWPLYIIGHGVSSRDEDGNRMYGARMTRGQISECLNYIMNVLKRDIAYVVIDYLQRIHPDNYEKNEPHMRQTVDWTRELALWCGCPVEVCAQAPRSLADKRYPLPGMVHVEWTNNAGQTADTMFTMWMPKTKLGVGTEIRNFGGFSSLVVEDSHMFMRVAKQREGPAGHVYLLTVKPDMLQWKLIKPTLGPYRRPEPWEKDTTREETQEEKREETQQGIAF